MTPPIVSVKKALARIPAGAHIVSAPGLGAPTTLLSAIGAAASGKGWLLSSGLLLGDYPFLGAVEAGELAYRTWHVMPPVRDLVADGAVGYVPARASRLAGLLTRWGIDVAIVRVSPPNSSGICSLGASVSYGMAAVHAAKFVIGEIDPSMPHTCGASEVDVSIFDSLVSTEAAMPQYRSAKPTDLSTKIAGHVLRLLPRSPTLQVGIGAIPETLVRSLIDADLGAIRFVGMATDEMVDLFHAGVLETSGPTLGSAILSPDMMGTDRLLEFSDGNPAIGMYPSDVSHDAARLGAIDRFVSVNTAVEVDLQGNVNSELVNGRQISGTGGSLDYVDAATRSSGGMRVIALPSASTDGGVSRIVPTLSTVTIPRTMVDFVVTEFGMARLDGLSLADRAQALIDIAHPDHQESLRKAAAP